MRLTQMLHRLNVLSILTIRRELPNPHSLIATMKNRIRCATVVAHVATKYSLAADMARDGEIDLSNIPTAEMPTDCFTKPLPKPHILKQCAEMGMIRIGIRNGLGNVLGALGNLHGNRVGTGNGIRNAVGK